MARRLTANERYLRQTFKVFDNIGRAALFVGGYRGRRRNVQGSGLLFFFGASFILYVLFGGAGADESENNVTANPAPPPPIIEQISEWGIDDLNSASMALEYCGIEDVRDYTQLHAGDITAYKAHCDDNIITIGVRDSHLIYIRVNGIDIYTDESGTIMNYNDATD